MENENPLLERASERHDSGLVTDTVLRAVAEREGCSQLDLPLLYESIDPDALNALFTDPKPPAGGSTVVEFEYAGYVVRVAEPGTVELCPVSPSFRSLVDPDPVD